MKLLKLERKQIKCHLDDRDQYKPGFKFNDWELKGVPVRIEIGPRDVAAGNAVLARRDTGKKSIVPMDGLEEEVSALLKRIQKGLLEKARRHPQLRATPPLPHGSSRSGRPQ